MDFQPWPGMRRREECWERGDGSGCRIVRSDARSNRWGIRTPDSGSRTLRFPATGDLLGLTRDLTPRFGSAISRRIAIRVNVNKNAIFPLSVV
jgi:hypothetical protein